MTRRGWLRSATFSMMVVAVGCGSSEQPSGERPDSATAGDAATEGAVDDGSPEAGPALDPTDYQADRSPLAAAYSADVPEHWARFVLPALARRARSFEHLGIDPIRSFEGIAGAFDVMAFEAALSGAIPRELRARYQEARAAGLAAWPAWISALKVSVGELDEVLQVDGEGSARAKEITLMLRTLFTSSFRGEELTKLAPGATKVPSVPPPPHRLVLAQKDIDLSEEPLDPSYAWDKARPVTWDNVATNPKTTHDAMCWGVAAGSAAAQDGIIRADDEVVTGACWNKLGKELKAPPTGGAFFDEVTRWFRDHGYAMIEAVESDAETSCQEAEKRFAHGCNVFVLFEPVESERAKNPVKAHVERVLGIEVGVDGALPRACRLTTLSWGARETVTYEGPKASGRPYAVTRGKSNASGFPAEYEEGRARLVYACAYGSAKYKHLECPHALVGTWKLHAELHQASTSTSTNAGKDIRARFHLRHSSKTDLTELKGTSALTVTRNGDMFVMVPSIIPVTCKGFDVTKPFDWSATLEGSITDPPKDSPTGLPKLTFKAMPATSPTYRGTWTWACAPFAIGGLPDGYDASETWSGYEGDLREKEVIRRDIPIPTGYSGIAFEEWTIWKGETPTE